MTVPCVYCLDTGELRDEQVLLRGHDFYLCAPRGQLVEGYLVIAPYRCVGCIAMLPREQFAELLELKGIVSAFYADVYGASDAMFYEQGRADGGASAETFPLHAHLCCLPRAPDVHAVLAEQFSCKDITGIDAVQDVAGPYVYVETRLATRVYVSRDERRREELKRMRLKPMLATLMGMPERGRWRDYPGDAELERLIERFKARR
ncbi:MAG TPA: hypothetical protein VGQ36_14685 [Thermoanaerobaculia bacterium]|jgi:diadenosine tetraphosphate (Ap4A) HIT family hydrolase|nr:hypothetical protein [Thermoanaerobaculia bacterium]